MPSTWFRLLDRDAASPSLHGVREGPFPRFFTTMRRSDSLPLVSPRLRCLRQGDTTRAPGSLPAAKARGRGLRGVDVPVPEPENDGGNGRASQVPGPP